MERLNQYWDNNWNGIKPFFPAILNPVPPTGGHGLSVHQNRASCVLRHSK